jgi:hypothetical protein
VVTLSSDKALADLAFAGGCRHAGGEQGEEREKVALTHLDSCLRRRRRRREDRESQLVSQKTNMILPCAMLWTYIYSNLHITSLIKMSSSNFLFGRAEVATPDFRGSRGVSRAQGLASNC